MIKQQTNVSIGNLGVMIKVFSVVVWVLKCVEIKSTLEGHEQNNLHICVYQWYWSKSFANMLQKLSKRDGEIDNTYFGFKYFTCTFLFNLHITCEVIIIISISLIEIWLFK